MPDTLPSALHNVISAVMPGVVARRVLPAFDQWQEHFHDAPWLLVATRAPTASLWPATSPCR